MDVLHGKTLQLEETVSDEERVKTLKALASLPRWRILALLAEGGRSINDLARALELPPSTVAAQVKILEDASFLHSELSPASHGLQKVCTRTYDGVLVRLPSAVAEVNAVETAMPVGAYTAFEAAPTCGLASASSLIGFLDDPLSFYEPARGQAELLWFRSGYVEYRFPNRLPKTARLSSLLFSCELCSEAPLHNDAWPSDITLWVNGCEVGTWTSPGDFGGQRGHLTPSWWRTADTQYGVLKRWLVNREGSFIDGHRLSALSVERLGVEEQPLITVRLGVKPDALHVGGLNLFGRGFGNYPQDLLLRLEYQPGGRLHQTQDQTQADGSGGTSAPPRRGKGDET